MSTTSMPPIKTPRRKKVLNIPHGYFPWSVIEAFSLHVNSKSYDILKYRGKTKQATIEKYDRVDFGTRISCEKIEHRFNKNIEELISALVFFSTSYSTDCIDNPSKKIHIIKRDVADDMFLSQYSKYKTRAYHRQESFKSDLSNLIPIMSSSTSVYGARRVLLDMLCKNSVDCMLNIYKAIFQKGFLAMGISFDTLVVIDHISKSSQKIMNDSDHKDSPFGDMATRINKLASLYSPDINKYERFILEYCKEQENNQITTE